MYTLTRKLSVICLTVVLSFLVYGCGGSSKQALITDVSTDMVTAAGLTPDSGTYNIQPGGTATAGDVTFECLAEGSSCEVTVTEADDGSTTVTSAGGMATARTSDSAAARLEAQRLQGLAEDAQAEAERLQGLAEDAQAEGERLQGLAEGDTAEAERLQGLAEDAQAEAERLQGLAEDAQAEAERLQGLAEGERDTANMNLEIAEGERDTANMNLEIAEGERDTANMNLEIAEGERDTANMNLEIAEGERDTANMNLEIAEGERDTAIMNLQITEGEQDALEMRVTIAEGERDTANMNLEIAEGERDTANMNLEIAEGERDTANMNLEIAEGERDTANMNLEIAEGERDDAIDAKNIAEAKANLFATANDTPGTGLAENYDDVEEDIYFVDPGTIKPLGNDVDANCPDTAVQTCVVVVTRGEDGVAYTSFGGEAELLNSRGVVDTRTAIALGGFGAGVDGDNVDGALITDATGPSIDTEMAGAGVTRSTITAGSVTEITLAHAGTNDNKYTPTDETDYRINGWPGQTLTRDDRNPEEEESMATDKDEVTVYTNIDPATPQKLTYGGTGTAVPPLSNTVTFVLDPGQDDDDSINMEISLTETVRSITGVFSGVRGTFTCDDTISCASITTVMNSGDDRVLSVSIGDGWTFESKYDVESQATQGDYMYFGYWLNSPVSPIDVPGMYEFDVIVGGSNEFTIDGTLTGNDDEVLTAVYEGGAAGMYVTRRLQIKDQVVNPQSPGYHGRFTARARLEATFGEHDDVEDDDHNKIGGTITNIMDGDKDLGFGVVTLEPILIVVNTGAVMGGMTKAEFGDTDNTAAAGTGGWSGQFYGPSAAVLNAALTAENPMATTAEMADIDSTLPTGIAGEFNVSSATGHTRVVGGFAAERTN